MSFPSRCALFKSAFNILIMFARKKISLKNLFKLTFVAFSLDINNTILTELFSLAIAVF